MRQRVELERTSACVLCFEFLPALFLSYCVSMVMQELAWRAAAACAFGLDLFDRLAASDE